MVFSFDMRTSLLDFGFISFFLCIPVVALVFGKRTYPGVSQWAIAVVSEFLGLLLIGLRGPVPEPVSVILGNLLTSGTMVFICRGLLDFVGERQRPWLDVGSLALLAALLAAFLLWRPDLNARIVVVSAMTSFLTGRCGMILWRKLPRVLPGRDWPLLGSLAFSGGWSLVRGVLALAHGEASADFMHSGAFQSLSVAVSVGCSVVLFISLIVMKVKRLERDLGAVRREVENLAELLPICSGCKRIRAEDGTWTQVETYVGRHSDLSFTHSLCPDCARRLYPEAAASMEKERRR